MNKALRFFTDPKVVASFMMYALLVAIGLINAELGPGLSYIANQTDTDLTEVSLIFTSRSVGYLVGCVTVGPVLDIINKECILLGCSVIIAGVVNCLIPFTYNIIWIHVISVIQGLSVGALDLVGDVCILLLHGDKAGPWIQALCFSLAFGTTISPVIVGAIINKYDNITVSFIIVGVICTVFGFGFCFSPPFRHKDSKGNPRRPETTPLLLPPQEKEEEEVESKKEESSTVPVEGIASDSTGVDDKFSAVPADRRDAVTPMMFWVAVAITTVFICVYTGFEVTFSGLLATYATEVGAASATGAAYMTSAFWGAFAVGRGVSIPLTIFIKPEAYLMIILVISAISILPSIFFTKSAAVWAMAVIRGLFIAPTWATVWHVLGNFVTINGKAGMVILIGGSTGQIVFPALCGFLMEKYGPVVLPAQQFACSCILLIVYGIFTWVTKYVFSRKFKKLSETPKTTAIN